MGRQKRAWHPKFKQYMRFIVEHPNYKGMPFPYKDNGKIRWIVARSSKIGLARLKWWDKKREKLGILKEGPWISKVARIIHPTELRGLKPCQICGEELSISYIYPNKNSLKKLNTITTKFQFSSYKEDIDEIVNALLDSLGKEGLSAIKKAFNISMSIRINENSIAQYIKENKKPRLSPGVMCDPPDRLDGFHTYNAPCRPLEDKGRHKSNLARYGEDRRAYEYWSEGDWKAASWLMKEFNKHGLSPDHIGPISLGFSHRPKFNPLTSSRNSAKNNRMSLHDVKTLIADEKARDTVVSWHSKFIWDRLKNAVATDSDALKLSKIMRQNLHNVLIILSEISRKGFDQFLISNYLHPEFAYYSIRVVDFDSKTGNYKKIEKKEGNLKQYSNNAKRYIRISLKSLKDYRLVKNRNAKISKSDKVRELLDMTIKKLSLKEYAEAKSYLNQTLNQLAEELRAEF